MPYDNEYNRMIADDIKKLNQKYIEHDKMTGEGLSGGFLGALAGMVLPSLIGSISKAIGGARDCECDDEDVAECVCGDAQKTGGSGFASGTMMDTGFDRAIGAGNSGGVGKYVKKKSKMGCGRSGGKKVGRPSKMLSMVKKEGAGGSGGGKKRGRPSKMKGEGIISDLGIPLISNVAGMFGLGTTGGKKRGRPSKMKGGAELGLPATIAGEGRSGGKKKEVKLGRGLVPKSEMKSSSMSGMGTTGGKKVAKGKSGGKKVNKRAEIVKKVMEEKKMSMIEASKYVKDHNLY
jgi:hypothetical protein